MEANLAIFQELKAQTTLLVEQAAAARAAEFEAVLADIRAKVTKYGLTEWNIFARAGWALVKTRERGRPQIPRPENGGGVVGEGACANWITDAKNRDR
ncbi:H-NS histone family protein [Paraburkholderia ferrariae]|uniref:H-NS histone family protein n=1 Tax=Paraburkholderia ferrariae TaxID=386056 RepID=UPI003D18C717